MDKAALYLRSSKDRADVSIDAQRRELQTLARSRGLIIVAEYADVVESGKDEHRPGFQRLLADLRAPDREWSYLLLLDTSRLSRRRHISIVFEELEARRRGVTLVYKSIPDADPIVEMLLKSILQAMDEWHSLTSKRKGLAGMAENVRQGYRAGGRAPRGYRLRRVNTGAVRDGEQVHKSVLEPSADAPLVGRYLRARAAGRSREALRRELGIGWGVTTLIGMEWNALTYAGHTVWGVHSEHRTGAGYLGAAKRRPREEWLIQRDTHEALITEGEADAILAGLGGSVHSKRRRTAATYLLSGLLKTPDGESWFGDGHRHYRTKPRTGRGRWLEKQDLEATIIGQVFHDLHSPELVRRLTAEAKRYRDAHRKDPAAELRRRGVELNDRITRFMDLAARLEDPGPALRKVDELERERKAMVDELLRSDRERVAAAAFDALTEADVERLLGAVTAEMEEMRQDALKDFLLAIIDRITLDPATLECQIHYRIGIEGRNRVASPRDPELVPVLRAVTKLRIG